MVDNYYMMLKIAPLPSLHFLLPVSEVHARTFAVWTALTCALCCICAFNLDDAPIYLATFLSFVAAFSHFFAEFVIYKTMSVKTFSLVGMIAGEIPTQCMQNRNQRSECLHCYVITCMCCRTWGRLSIPLVLLYVQVFVVSCWHEFDVAKRCANNFLGHVILYLLEG